MILAQHVIDRFQQRFGLAVSLETVRRMEAAIESGSAEFVRDKADGASVWTIKVQGVTVAAIYCPVRQHVVTVHLPNKYKYYKGSSDKRAKKMRKFRKKP